MPTIDRVGGFLVRIYSNDHQPAHVHVVKGGGMAVIEIAKEAAVREAYDMSPADLRRAIAIVEERCEQYLSEWMRIHESTNRSRGSA